MAATMNMFYGWKALTRNGPAHHGSDPQYDRIRLKIERMRQQAVPKQY